MYNKNVNYKNDQKILSPFQFYVPVTKILETKVKNIEGFLYFRLTLLDERICLTILIGT